MPRSIRWTSRGQERSTRPDVQAALTVVGHRDPDRDIQPIDLARATLNGATLTSADLTGAKLSSADLTDADLTDARWPEGELVPEGYWLRPTGARRHWF